MSVKRVLLTALAASVLVATPAVAGGLTRDQLRWTTDHPDAKTVGFGGLTNSFEPIANPIIVGDLTISGGNLFAFNSSFRGSVSSIADISPNGFVNVALAPATAFALFIANNNDGGGVPIVTLSSGGRDTFTFTPMVGGVMTEFTFIGIDGVGHFDNVRIDANGIDNFVSIGEVSFVAVPDTATWALLIVGFGLTGNAMRRRRAAII